MNCRDMIGGDRPAATVHQGWQVETSSRDQQADMSRSDPSLQSRGLLPGRRLNVDYFHFNCVSRSASTSVSKRSGGPSAMFVILIGGEANGLPVAAMTGTAKTAMFDP